MRKSRFTLRDVNEVTIAKFDENLNNIFSIMEELDISIPKWAKMLFVFSVKDKIDVSFFEEINDFFIWYSKVLIKRKDSMIVSSFKYDDILKQWQLFFPPTLIGVNLETRMRF